jgi:hypothetical protein
LTKPRPELSHDHFRDNTTPYNAKVTRTVCGIELAIASLRGPRIEYLDLSGGERGDKRGIFRFAK